MPNYALGVTDFVTIGADAMEDYETPNPTDFKLEPKPRPLTSEGDWAEAVQQRNHVYGLTCGYEYVSQMDGAAKDFRQTSKDMPHILPFPIMMDVFEELAGRHEEKIEESLRDIYRKSGSD